VEQIQGKYLIDANFFSIKPKKLDSWAWKCILKNPLQFRKRIQWKVGNGISINFWLDNYYANDSLANMLNITNNSLIDTSLKVSHFITGNKEWDVARLQPLVDLVQL